MVNAVSRNPATWAVVAAFFAIYVVWGSTYLAIRWAVETIPPLLMAATRFLIAGSVLYAFLRLRKVPSPTRLEWRNGALVGTLLLVTGNGIVCWSEQYVESGMTALIICGVPLYMAILDWLVFRGPKPGARSFVGLALGISGVVLLVGPGGDGTHTTHFWGAMALLLASVSWSVGSLVSRRVSLPQNAFMATAIEMLAGGVVLLLVATLRGEWSLFAPSQFTSASLWGVAYLIVMGSLVGFSAYVWLLTVVSPAAVSTYAFVNPCVAVFIGYIFGGERLDQRILFAAVMIISAVVLITVRRRPQTAG